MRAYKATLRVFCDVVIVFAATIAPCCHLWQVSWRRRCQRYYAKGNMNLLFPTPSHQRSELTNFWAARL